ncbi:SP_0198 family lipoprotein [Streptococcus equinus]|uniref:SP_0198 family lipoprotein n=1 Tax=Streptococcus equinus TaxID=1335 RepID=UPI00088A53CA|nr:SP_0198 family lipoprotein [Streptococcus equinus]SDI38141.1 lipoprotein [Streptococcus equinus]SEP58139.1 lipoprotein [Streptococcus equinus]
MNKIVKLTGVALLSIFLGACQANQATDSSSQASSSQQVSSSTTSASAETTPSSSEASAVETQSTELDGTYVLKEADEVKTLTIKDGAGSLESKENDGEVDVDQVKVDASKQTILIGDDLKDYRLDGNQLILTEDDGDQDIYTKQ